jgi:acetyltransferase-like isoleucine patch superfamily enzyme
MRLGRTITSLLLLVLPTRLAAPLLRLCGYRIGADVRVGFSLVMADRLSLGDGSRIGHLNFIRVRRLILHPRADINRANIANGPLALHLLESASIGNRNKITRGSSPDVVCWGASLVLRRGARLTADHLVDCTRSVDVGEYSIVAGSGSQLWTHGYVHHAHGPGRYRIDGPIRIGHNVYLGSRCIVNLGVSIAASSTVGAGTVVSRSIDGAGLYVGASMRSLSPIGEPDGRADLVPETGDTLCEPVYFKRRKP